MTDYILLTDSCCDLPADVIKEIDIRVLNLHFIMDGVEYENNIENPVMDPKEYYDKLREGTMPTTSAINVGTFEDEFRSIAQEGKDVLYIAFSSALSVTYNSACIAAQMLKEEFPQRKFLVVDSLCASTGQGLFVYYIARKRLEGMGIDELYRWALDNRLHLCHQFTVDSLMHLLRGGRVSAASAIVGSIIGIKPILHVDNTGHLVKLSTVRGRKASVQTLIKTMEQTCYDLKGETCAICHGDCLKDAEIVAERMYELGAKRVIITHTGPVIGAHSGPGTLAIFYFGKER